MIVDDDVEFDVVDDDMNVSIALVNVNTLSTVAFLILLAADIVDVMILVDN